MYYYYYTNNIVNGTILRRNWEYYNISKYLSIQVMLVYVFVYMYVVYIVLDVKAFHFDYSLASTT